MHQLWAGLTGGHGHSHAPGTECSGHAHDSSTGGQRPQLTEEMRQKLLRHLEAQMEMMQAAHGDVISHGHVLRDPSSPDPGSYSHLLYGYGHEPATMPTGWGSLASSSSPMTSSMMPVGEGDMMHATGGSKMERDRFWLLNVPRFGRFRIVKDRAGLVQAFCVVLYWLYGNWSTWNAILLPYYADGVLPLWLLLLYAAVSVLCITSFVRASTMNPGSLHVSHHPQADWTECTVCKIQRPPLSHHCRRCGHCVRRMDHHCPWINNCVGEENQFAFMLLLLYAFLLSTLTAVALFLYFFRFESCITCHKESFVIQYQNEILYVDIVLSVGMVSASLALFFTQHMGVMLETPTVEWMKLQREMFITGVMPKQMTEEGRPLCQLYADLCGAPYYCWLFPCRRRRTKHTSATTSV